MVAGLRLQLSSLLQVLLLHAAATAALFPLPALQTGLARENA